MFVAAADRPDPDAISQRFQPKVNPGCLGKGLPLAWAETLAISARRYLLADTAIRGSDTPSPPQLGYKCASIRCSRYSPVQPGCRQADLFQTDDSGGEHPEIPSVSCKRVPILTQDHTAVTANTFQDRVQEIMDGPER